jgi:hypothetical protein
MSKSTYRGFELFNDIEDAALRTRNRAVVLANIAENHTRNRLISPNGAGLLLGYFGCIPIEERRTVQEAFVVNMKERGFVLQAA